jgi:hypothetical protein
MTAPDGEPPLLAPDVAPAYGTELVGRHHYRLMKRLGRGAYGAVYLARCLDAGRGGEAPPEAVAIKLLSAPAVRDRAQTLRRELAALLALRHDRIPRVHDWDLDGPVPFVVVDHYGGGDVRDLLASGTPAPEEVVWRLLGDVLSALVAAHRASILHLDVKPANVLLDGRGGFVLTDFGFSQAARIRHGILPRGLGAPGYQAPEQRSQRFDLYDVRTDLWGVGATAWSLATGLSLGDRLHLLREIGSGAEHGLPMPRELGVAISRELEQVLLGLLALEPARRSGSAAEVLARVQAFVGAAPRAPRDRRRGRLSADEAEALVASLVDPLHAAICREAGFARYLAVYEDAEHLCREGDRSYHAFLLLRGRVRIEREGAVRSREAREGTFLGEVSTLTGLARTASIVAEGRVHVAVLNAAELDELVLRHPAVATRLLRALAQRVAEAYALGPGGAGGR